MENIKSKATAVSRNVLFSKKVEDFLEDLQNKAASIKVQRYIRSNLRRWLVKFFDGVKPIKKAELTDPFWLQDALNRGDEVYILDLSRENMETFSHWIDYLNTLEDDISRISIPQLMIKVKQWDLSFAKKNVNEEDGIEVIHTYSDGFLWAKVFGKNSLSREGTLMNHCVGSYYNNVKDGRTSIYSLRDHNNSPHCTIEITDGIIKQIKGNSNSSIKDEYVKYIIDFLDKKYVWFGSIHDYELLNAGLVKINGKLYRLNSLPEDLTVDGDLDLSYSSITNLPDGLHVKGYLDLSSTHVANLPEDLTVDGDLILKCTKISSLPSNLNVGKNLYLYDTKISSLPSDLNVGEDLDLSYSSIASLPEGLHVKGNLSLRGTGIARLPENLTVDGDLDLTYTKITRLPGSLKVGNNLYLGGNNIVSLLENSITGGPFRFKLSL